MGYAKKKKSLKDESVLYIVCRIYRMQYGNIYIYIYVYVTAASTTPKS